MKLPPPLLIRAGRIAILQTRKQTGNRKNKTAWEADR